MCIAIYRPPSRRLPKENIRRAFTSNKDGAGFAYALNDGLMVYRDPAAKFDTFWPVLRDALRGDAKNAPMVVHFRFATHGAISEPNTHPIITHGGRNAIVHNGVISASPTSKEDDRSDTVLFCTQLIEALPERLDQHPELQPYLSSLIGYSKLVILNASGAVTFLRATAGTWHEEVWYSNTNALPWTKTSTTTLPLTTSTPAVQRTAPHRPSHDTSQFRRVGTFDSTRKNVVVKIDAFLSQYGTLYVRAKHRKGGGGFYGGDVIPGQGGYRMCDACNDELAVGYNDTPNKCFQRLCSECLADWQFIKNFLDANPSEPANKTRKKKKMKRLTDKEIDDAFGIVPEADVTPPPPAITLVPDPAPLPEPQPTDAVLALLAGQNGQPEPN